MLVKEVVDPSANTIFGATIDENYNDKIQITVIATGFQNSSFENASGEKEEKKEAPKPQATGFFDRAKFAEFLAGKPISSITTEEKNPVQQPQSASSGIKLFADEFKPVQQPKREEPVFEQKREPEAPKFSFDKPSEREYKETERPETTRDVGITSSRVVIDNDDLLPPFLRKKR